MNHRSPQQFPPAPPIPARGRRARLTRVLSLTLRAVALGVLVLAAILPVLVLTTHRTPSARPSHATTVSTVAADECAMFCADAEKPTATQPPTHTHTATYPSSTASADTTAGCWMFCAEPGARTVEFTGGSGGAGPGGGVRLNL